MEVVNSQSISKPVILLKILENNTLAAVNSDSVVRMLDVQKLTLISGFKVGITHKRYRTKVLDFSHDAQYFATISATVRESLLYSSKTKNDNFLRCVFYG